MLEPRISVAGKCADRSNRKLYPDDKKAIHDKMNGDETYEKRLTRAALMKTSFRLLRRRT